AFSRLSCAHLSLHFGILICARKKTQIPRRKFTFPPRQRERRPARTCRPLLKPAKLRRQEGATFTRRFTGTFGALEICSKSPSFRSFPIRRLGNINHDSATTGFRSVPIFSISTSTTSPAFR